MRFAVVGPAPPFRGGIAQHTRAIESALVADHTVVVHPLARLYPKVLFPGTSQLPPDPDPPLCQRGEPLDPYRPGTWGRVARAIAAAQPDLVLVQWWHPWFAAPTARLLGRCAKLLGSRDRLALLCHNVEPHGRVPLQRWLARRVLRRAGRLILHAGSEAERAAKLAPGVPCHVLPMPRLMAGERVPQGTARNALGLEPGRWLLFFGLVRGYKGLEDLLIALQRIADPGTRLLVVGEFYEPEGGYRRQIEALGLGDRVRIINRFIADDEIPTVFGACDLVVLPYREATQSSVLPHAIHHRRPAVVTDAGGLPELAPETCTVVARSNPEALAAGIQKALATAPESWDFSAATRRTSLETLRDGLVEVARG